jgi:predicted transcriptional regulator
MTYYKVKILATRLLDKKIINTTKTYSYTHYAVSSSDMYEDYQPNNTVVLLVKLRFMGLINPS